jgi:tRNA threonylcarbamoyladenosine biosynthesis protein TsaB
VVLSFLPVYEPQQKSHGEKIVRVLALETSAPRGSVAALEDGLLLRQQETPEGTRSAQMLAPTIAHLLAQVGWNVGDIQLVAVTQGPGSFTGLRIGAITAKTLAYVTGASVIGVNTLEAIAAQAISDRTFVWSVLDAQRQQLFCARYVAGEGSADECVRPTAITDRPAFLDSLSENDSVIGPGLRPLIDSLPSFVHLADQADWHPRAETVGKVALLRLEDDGPSDLWDLTPNYYRKSAAEERL